MNLIPTFFSFAFSSSSTVEAGNDAGPDQIFEIEYHFETRLLDMDSVVVGILFPSSYIEVNVQ